MEPPFWLQTQENCWWLTLACVSSSRSCLKVGRLGSLKRSKWAWLLKFRARFAHNCIIETPFKKSWIHHWQPPLNRYVQRSLLDYWYVVTTRSGLHNIYNSWILFRRFLYELKDQRAVCRISSKVRILWSPEFF